MSNSFRQAINRPKISFGCLKLQNSGITLSQYNKQNQLSFQNLKNDRNMASSQKKYITRKMSNQESSDISLSTKLKNKIKSPAESRKASDCADMDIFESYKPNEEVILKNKLSFQSKALTNSNNLKYQQQFLQTQQKIRSCIESYNTKFNQILQCLTDMQIRDLMKYNEMIQKNQRMYEFWLKINRVPSFLTVGGQQANKIGEVANYIDKVCGSKAVCFDFRSTIDSKTLTNPKISPTPPKKQPICKCSCHKLKNSLEDTPESVKSRLSEVSNKIRVAPNKKIQMFDRINICQSIQGDIIPMSISFKSEEQKDKKQYRYGRVSEE